jgi:hypothetical protein
MNPRQQNRARLEVETLEERSIPGSVCGDAAMQALQANIDAILVALRDRDRPNACSCDDDFKRHGQEVAIFPLDSKPFGHTYGQWAELWESWALEKVPVHQNPLFDFVPTTYENSNAGLVGASDDVVFLGGAFDASTANRSVTVPCGTALFLPVLNAEDDTVFPGAANGGPGTDAELKATVTNDMNFFLSQQAPFLKIGDAPNHLQAVDNVTQYRVQSPVFNITFRQRLPVLRGECARRCSGTGDHRRHLRDDCPIVRGDTLPGNRRHATAHPNLTTGELQLRHPLHD